MNYRLILFIVTLQLSTLHSNGEINSYSLNFSPYFSRQEVRPITEINKDNTSPWMSGFCVKLQARDDITETNRFLYGIGYNSGILIADDLHTYNPIGFSTKVQSLELCANYSFDILLSHKLILNPEIGISSQLPIIGQYSSSSSEYRVNFKTVAPPALGINLNVWIKPHNSSLSDMGIGICGNLPVFRSTIGEIRSQETHATSPVKIGMGYLGMAICYTFHQSKR